MKKREKLAAVSFILVRTELEIAFFVTLAGIVYIDKLSVNQVSQRKKKTKKKVDETIEYAQVTSRPTNENTQRS